MTFQVIIQPRAERDIRNHVAWIIGQSNSPATALRWARALRNKIDTLKTTPLRCPVDPDSDAYGEEVRVLLHGKRQKVYRILYVIRGDAVHVVAVRHAAQRSLSEELEDSGDDPLH
jgi:plasmid stabilization system protein ParE